MKGSEQPEYRQNPHLVQQNLCNPSSNPVMPMFHSGAGLRKRWQARLIAPLVMPLQDRTKNTCLFCSHMITIPLVNAIASGKVPIENTFNQFMNTNGFRTAFVEAEKYSGPQGRNTILRGSKWTYPSPPKVIDSGKKRKNDDGDGCSKRVKVEEETSEK